MTIQVIGILGLFVLMVVLMMTKKAADHSGSADHGRWRPALIAGIPFMGGEFSIARTF